MLAKNNAKCRKSSYSIFQHNFDCIYVIFSLRVVWSKTLEYLILILLTFIESVTTDEKEQCFTHTSYIYFSKTIELSLGFSCKNSKYFIFVKHDTLLSLNSAVWRRKWQLSPAFLPGEFHGQRRLAGNSLCHLKEIGHNWTTFHFTSYETMRSQVAQAHFPERWRKSFLDVYCHRIRRFQPKHPFQNISLKDKYFNFSALRIEWNKLINVHNVQPNSAMIPEGTGHKVSAFWEEKHFVAPQWSLIQEGWRSSLSFQLISERL